MTLLYANEDGLNADTRVVNYDYFAIGDKTKMFENSVAAAFSGTIPASLTNALMAKNAMACLEMHAYVSWLFDASCFSGPILNYVDVIQKKMLHEAAGFMANADNAVMMAITKDYTYKIMPSKDEKLFRPKQVPTLFGSSGQLAASMCEVFTEPQELFNRCSKFDGMINTKITHIARSSLSREVPKQYIFKAFGMRLDLMDKEILVAMLALAVFFPHITLTKTNKPKKRPPNIKDFREACQYANAKIKMLEEKTEEQIKEEYRGLFCN